MSYTIFERKRSHRDDRVRWHAIPDFTAVEAESSQEALDHFVRNDSLTLGYAPGYSNADDCTVVIGFFEEQCQILAFETEAIDFDHYDTEGRFVAAPTPPETMEEILGASIDRIVDRVRIRREEIRDLEVKLARKRHLLDDLYFDLGQAEVDLAEYRADNAVTA